MRVFITGASSGIGEACAEIFAKSGAELILTARRKPELEKLAARLEKSYAIQTIPLVMDVSRRTSAEEVLNTPQLKSGPIDVLINNAGLARGMDPVQNGKIEDWEEMIDTNLKGLLYVTRSVLPIMLQAGGGHIVNIGSVAGHWAYPKGNVYCATKSAVRAFTEALRMDLNGTGIRVTEISPGMVKTHFSNVRLGDDQKADAVYAGLTPLSAMDVAETVYWSVSRPKHVNIQEIIVYPTDQASPTLSHRR